MIRLSDSNIFPTNLTKSIAVRSFHLSTKSYYTTVHTLHQLFIPSIPSHTCHNLLHKQERPLLALQGSLLTYLPLYFSSNRPIKRNLTRIRHKRIFRPPSRRRIRPTNSHLSIPLFSTNIQALELPSIDPILRFKRTGIAVSPADVSATIRDTVERHAPADTVYGVGISWLRVRDAPDVETERVGPVTINVDPAV